MPTFTDLRTEAATLADLDGTLGLLGWDQEVNLPRGAAQRRASQLSTLAAIRHERMTTRLLPLARQLQDHPNGLSDDERLNLDQLLRNLDKAARLPVDLVAELTHATSTAQQAWEHAKTHNDFAAFQPHLERLVDLKRRQANYYTYAASPYDALLDDYEPGATTELLDRVFLPLVDQLRPWVPILAQAPPVPDQWLTQPMAREHQWQLGLTVLRHMGYDFDRGRQDESMHPFSTSFGMEDVRITTHITPDDVQGMLYSTIHECGHALYEQGLDPAWYGLPGAEACSLSIHESQSRIWENCVARSQAFCEFLWPHLAPLLPDGHQHTAQDLFRAVNRVQPSLIRIYADELTYHFHILLRYELERGLMEGTLAVADLPARWNDRMYELLGVTVPDDTRGVLQDVHWSHGSFGYFPTYSLGSFYAAQFWNAALTAHPDLPNRLRQGDCSQLRKWLATNVWQHGRRYLSEELCRRATGEGLSVSSFVGYLRSKLETVYAVQLPTGAQG